MLDHLTDRQQLLFDRLVTLGDWATKGELPMRVLEIRGFGSFFRGKPRPQDVDLLIRIQRPEHLPEFDLFVGLLKQIRCDWDLEERYDTPMRAIAALASASDERLNGISPPHIKRFLNWVESYSWKMLRPQTIHGQCSFSGPEDYAKRMIKKTLPNLNVFQFMNPRETDQKPSGLRCGFTVSIWSEDRPNTADNLTALMTETAMRSNAIRELAYFEVQHQEISALVAYHEAEIELLQRIPKRKKKADCSWTWFNAFSTDHSDLAEVSTALKLAQQNSNEFVEQKWGRATSSSEPTLSLTKLASQVDKQRKGIKRLFIRNDLLESLRTELAHFKSGAATTDLKAEEYAVVEMLRHGSKSEKVKKADFLRDMGFPVDRMLKRMAKHPFRYGGW